MGISLESIKENSSFVEAKQPRRILGFTSYEWLWTYFGVMGLLGWNIQLQLQQSYSKIVFGNEADAAGNDPGSFWTKDMPGYYTLGIAVVQVFVHCGMNSFNKYFRICWWSSLAGNLIGMGPLFLVPLMMEKKKQSDGFALPHVLAALGMVFYGVFSALLINQGFSLAASLEGPVAINLVSLGQALGGAAMLILMGYQAVTDRQDWSIRQIVIIQAIYLVCVLACYLTYFKLVKHPKWTEVMDAPEDNEEAEDMCDEEEAVGINSDGVHAEMGEDVVLLLADEGNENDIASQWTLFKNSWQYQMTACLGMFGTFFALMPLCGWMNSSVSGKDLVPTLAVFMIGDPLGRSIVLWFPQFAPKGNLLFILTCVRTFVLVLLTFCFSAALSPNRYWYDKFPLVNTHNQQSFLWHLFRNNWFRPLIATGFLALSQGYLLASAQRFGPDTTKKPKEKQILGSLTVVVLSWGMWVGSLSPNILESINPKTT